MSGLFWFGMGMLTGMILYTLTLFIFTKEYKMPCGGKRRKRK